ncbi:MAG: hypothetical protein ACTSWP_09735 [Candidatus Freyarchaeota archaeon]|nr:hypothetical protein [Candidatus Freyrarchaeum guaymaensis]
MRGKTLAAVALLAMALLLAAAGPAIASQAGGNRGVLTVYAGGSGSTTGVRAASHATRLSVNGENVTIREFGVAH